MYVRDMSRFGGPFTLAFINASSRPLDLNLWLRIPQRFWHVST
jgi:hypothetical protein